MKLAVLSDVHGNLPALEAVAEELLRWRPDRIVINGDLINRGPNSLACLQLLQRAFPTIELLKGNHEEFVLSCAARDDHPHHPTFELRRFAHWTHAQLGEAMQQIAQWPDHLDEASLAGSLHITHASRRGKRDGISQRTTDEELAEKLGERRSLFITSHTHKPLIRRFDTTLIVNTGSVGSPSDHDPRAAYGRFQFDGHAWHAEIARIAFDRERALRDFSASGFIEQGGALTRLMREELRHARIFVGPWNERYLEAVLTGTIDVASAVQQFLADELGRQQ
ncbi:MAG TPA: metallophosphoesterase family protein [Gammaproteobacteria bacterium]